MRTQVAVPDHYAVLEVLPTASPEVVRAAYRVLVRHYHPDAAPDHLRAAHTERTKGLNAAKEVLCDPHSRAAYDADRLAAAPPSVRTEPVWAPSSTVPPVVVAEPVVAVPIVAPVPRRAPLGFFKWLGIAFAVWWGVYLLAFTGYVVLKSILGL